MRGTSSSVLLALALLGCGTDRGNGPDLSPVTGRWAGPITGGAPDNVLMWTLEDTDGRVSGSGAFTTGGTSVELSMDGTFSSPHLTLTVRSQAFNDFTFTGTVSENSMKGRLNGSGFVNRAVTLTRH